MAYTSPLRVCCGRLVPIASGLESELGALSASMYNKCLLQIRAGAIYLTVQGVNFFSNLLFSFFHSWFRIKGCLQFVSHVPQCQSAQLVYYEALTYGTLLVKYRCSSAIPWQTRCANKWLLKCHCISPAHLTY